MSRRNSQRSQAISAPTSSGREQQQQQHQRHATTNSKLTNSLFTRTPTTTSQEIVNTFILDRYSRHNHTATTYSPVSSSSTHSRSGNTRFSSPANQANNNVAQTKISTFGGASTSPRSLPPPLPSPSRTATTTNSRNNNNYSTMSIASDSRSWSVSTTSTATTAVAGVGGRSLPETKEQSNWIHLSTPNHRLTLTLKLFFRPQTQADLDNCRPLLLIQTSNEILECLGLDRASVRSSKLRGVVKGSMIGFRYTSSSFSSSTLASAPGSHMSESHKFQIKFKSLADCGQCASFLSNWIECQSIASQESPSTYLATTITTAAASTNASSQTVVQSSQDTDVAMAPPLAHLQLDHVSSNSNNLRRLDGAHPWSQHSSAGAIGISSPALYSSSPTTISVGNEELANILRSAAANNTFLPLTMATATDTSMSPPPPPQQQQRNRQERLASVKPQFASSSMPVTSNFSSMTAGPPHMTSVALSSPGRGGQSLQSSVSASLQQRDSETREGSLNNIGNNENSISTTDDLSALLNLSNAELQEDINSILHDPSFPEVLLKVDRLLRGPYSKR